MWRKLRWLATVIILSAAACSQDPAALKKQYMESGDKFFAEKKYPEAIIQYRNAITQDVRFAEAHARLAATYDAAGDIRNATIEYVRAADLMTGDADAQARAGKALIQTGQYNEARERALHALEKDPKNVNALLVLGNSMAGLRDLPGAIKQLEEAVDAAPMLPFTYTNLAMLEVRSRNLPAAESAFQRALALDEKSIDAHLNLGNFYWASGRYTEAEAQFKAALALDEKQPLTQQTLTAFYFGRRDLKAAEAHLKSYADLVPGAGPQLALADFYIVQNRQADAIAVLKPLTERITPETIPAFTRLAALDYQAGRKADAHASMDRVLKEQDKNELALQTKARFLIAEDRFAEAATLIDAALKANAKNATSQYLRGMIFEGQGLTDQAINSFTEALAIAPSAVPAKLQLAVIYVARREPAAALEILSPIVKAQPSLGGARLLLGQAYLLAGNLSAAENELVPLAKVNPKSAEIQTWLGRLYGMKKENVLARQAFGRALELEPTSIPALTGLTAIDLVEGKKDAARARIDARVAASKAPDLLMMAGMTYDTLGDTKKAEATFQELIKVDPNRVDGYVALGRLYARERRLDEAKVAWEKVAAQPSGSVGATTMLGAIYALQNKPAEAKKQYEKAVEMDPKAAVASNNLAWLYASENTNLDLALRLAQTAKSRQPDNPDFSDTLGWIYYLKGVYASAVDTLQQGVKQAPSNPLLHYHLGMAQWKNGNLNAARQSLQQALKLSPNFKGADEAQKALKEIG